MVSYCKRLPSAKKSGRGRNTNKHLFTTLLYQRASQSFPLSQYFMFVIMFMFPVNQGQSQTVLNQRFIQSLLQHVYNSGIESTANSGQAFFALPRSMDRCSRAEKGKTRCSDASPREAKKGSSRTAAHRRNKGRRKKGERKESLFLQWRLFLSSVAVSLPLPRSLPPSPPPLHPTTPPFPTRPSP